MKRIVPLALALAVAGVTHGRVEYVGHRGSDIGVENTEVAFRNGVQRGYDYIECDVRVTADTQLVISHDTDTRRLGGNCVIADATLAQLRSEYLQQKRKSGEYRGRISTLSEYLAICRDGNTRPLIELKWSNGINSNDFSNIPLLISAIDEAGMRNQCIILTSMRPCLEYIRRQWPDINIQFLGAKNWSQYLPWCIENKIDVDIAHDCLEQHQIDLCHKLGLKVNCWTVDDPQRAAELEQMGVDMITTNSLPVK